MKILLLAMLALAAGCPADDSCGPGDAPGDGLTVSGGAVSLRYHQMTASPNNDCPDPAAPAGVVSLSLTAIQVSGADALVLCIPRPDMLESDLPVVASTATHTAAIEIQDVNASDAGCTLTDSAAMAPTGTGHAEGICMDGTDPAGFALLISGQVSVDRDCSGTIDTLRLDLAGTISVTPE